jgi:DNA-binding NarL/FixJ family response regulator
VVAHAGSVTVAVLTDRRLPALALAAVLATDLAEHHAEAHGDRAIQALLTQTQPKVLIEGRSEWWHQVDAGDWSRKVLLLMDPDSDQGVFQRASNFRIDGYLNVGASAASFQDAVGCLVSQGRYVDPSLAQKIGVSREIAAKHRAGPLSGRELQILAAIAAGYSSKEIGSAYSVSPKTIRNHVSRIYTKLNLTHRGELVMYAEQVGLAYHQVLTTRSPAVAMAAS